MDAGNSVHHIILCLPLLAILLGLLTGAGNTWDHIQKYYF